jgi:hypothetical protein
MHRLGRRPPAEAAYYARTSDARLPFTHNEACMKPGMSVVKCFGIWPH